MWVEILLVALGSALGGSLRYLVSNGVHLLLPRIFPSGTLIVNITGCLVMGFLYALLSERSFILSNHLRAFLMIGLLGGYTTFSSFSAETLSLLENGKVTLAFIYIFASVGICLLATWGGLLIGRQ